MRDGRPQQTAIFLLLLAPLLLSCLTPAEKREREVQYEQMQGSRRLESPERRTAANRPKPWVEEKGPFQADRLDIEPYRAWKHSKETTKIPPSPSLRDCLRLEETYPCPLLAHRWTARDIEGGIELTVTATRTQADRLRDLVRCYAAYSKSMKRGGGCLSQFLPARISGGYRKGVMLLRLVVDQYDRVQSVRQQARALIGEAR